MSFLHEGSNGVLRRVRAYYGSGRREGWASSSTSADVEGRPCLNASMRPATCKAASVRVTLCGYRFIASKPGDATMQRLLVLAIIAALVNCAAPSNTPPPQGAGNSARVGKSEAAPFTRPIDYVSPDSRERLCSGSQLASRDNSYGMLTKPTTSYYCF
jgi:hypothetical protein